MTALSLSLAACVTDPALMGTTVASSSVKTKDLPREAKLLEGVYAAKADPQFNVPAVPVEKVPQQFQRQTVVYETDQPVGTIIINPGAKHLYLVTGKNKAVRYGIAVGRAGFQWSGEALITDRKTWPSWTPPKEMIERKPELAKWEKGQPGGLDNPLGARALYLTTNGVDYGYRIHGTPEWNSIGRSASSGCIRMINQDVMDLYERVPNNTKVIVLNADGSMPKGLTLPPPQPKKAKPAEPAIVVPKPAVMPAPIITNGAPAVVPAPAATVMPAVAPAAPAPAAAAAPAAATPAPAPTATPAAAAQPAAACLVALVNGVCPSN
ncbi:L,D-transpeptidase [Rhodobacteraceae bacterium KMS-5]|uniref:L,D-transpeptidase n=2 Tax=Tabrizicola oligotrophica TaxID=2710650 RepID=A0A6M0QPK7_9RHOB|nr:L,D-transpeptidase [Tabrizicola oligotrophica]